MMNNPSLIFQTLQAVILIGAFLAWPAIIKKIASARKMEPIDPIQIQKMIRLRWRYGSWILMVWVFLKLFNRFNF